MLKALNKTEKFNSPAIQKWLHRLKEMKCSSSIDKLSINLLVKSNWSSDMHGSFWRTLINDGDLYAFFRACWIMVIKNFCEDAVISLSDAIGCILLSSLINWQHKTAFSTF